MPGIRAHGSECEHYGRGAAPVQSPHAGNGEEPLMLEQTSMEELFDRADPELGGGDARKVKALIRQILQYETVRKTGSQI